MKEKSNNKKVNKVADYLILNAYSLNNIGFYNGKAGISLCLFEVAEYLQNTNIEEHAFELLQEALILGEKKKNITFESGLSGIGFVLLYLLSNKLLEGDFEELFSKYVSVILSVLEKENSFQNGFIRYIRFLAPLYKMSPDEQVDNCIKKILRETESYFEQQLNEFPSINSKLIKSQILTDFSEYLTIISKNNCTVSSTIMEQYCILYKNNKIPGRFEVAFYLNQLINKEQNIDSALLNEVMNSNEEQALHNIELNGKYFTLADRTNLLYLFSQDSKKYKKYIIRLEQDLLKEPDDHQFQKNILKVIPQNKFALGYEQGISRFLLYWIYKDLKSKRKNTIRFNSLF